MMSDQCTHLGSQPLASFVFTRKPMCRLAELSHWLSLISPAPLPLCPYAQRPLPLTHVAPDHLRHVTSTTNDHSPHLLRTRSTLQRHLLFIASTVPSLQNLAFYPPASPAADCVSAPLDFDVVLHFAVADE